MEFSVSLLSLTFILKNYYNTDAVLDKNSLHSKYLRMVSELRKTEPVKPSLDFPRLPGQTQRFWKLPT